MKFSQHPQHNRYFCPDCMMLTHPYAHKTSRRVFHGILGVGDTEPVQVVHIVNVVNNKMSGDQAGPEDANGFIEMQ
jgi:hypothetical protein